MSLAPGTLCKALLNAIPRSCTVLGAEVWQVEINNRGKHIPAIIGTRVRFLDGTETVVHDSVLFIAQ